MFPPLSTAALVNLERIFKCLTLPPPSLRLKLISVANRRQDYFGVIHDCKYSDNNLAAKKFGNTLNVVKISGINLNSSNESRKVGLKRQFQMCVW